MQTDAWFKTTLGAIADGQYGLVDGPFGSNLPGSDYTQFGIPVVRGSNLSLGEARFKGHEFVYVSDKTASRLERSICRPGDIVFTKKGTIGQTGFIPNDGRFARYLLSSNQMKLSVDPKIADPLFVYYVASSPMSREKIVRDASITGVPKTNVAYLKSFPIDLPPLQEQQAIAHILGSLDDKIELNGRMNGALEAMVRALFKSWFVDFDPVRAKAEGRAPNLPKSLADHFPDFFEDSELGQIPKGWKTGRIGDLCYRVLDKVDGRNTWQEERLIDLSRMPQRSIALVDWGLGAELSTSVTRFRRLDTLFGAIRPYFHKVGIAPMNGVTNVSIFVMRAILDMDWPFVVILCSMTATVEYATRVSRGTKMPVVNWPDFANYMVPLPPVRTRKTFNTLADPMLNRIAVNIQDSRALAATRDTLLPKLISGELRVKNAKRLVKELSS
jgi:type I restriction enzyme S subunit